MTRQSRRPAAVGSVLVLLVCAALRVNGQTITLVGTDPQGALKFTTTTRKATFSIPVELDKDAVDDFRVVVDDFVAPDGRVIPVTVTIDKHPPPGKMAIKQADRPALSVAADFPITGDYKSRIVMFYDGKRVPSVPMTVTRQLTAISLRVDAVDARAATVYGGGNASMRVIVQETVGQQVTIDPPAIVNLALKRGEKVQREAHYRRVDLRRLHGRDAVPADPCATNEQRTNPDGGTPVATSFTVEPLGQADFLLTLCGIEEVGEYNGTVRVSNRDTTPAEKVVTIYVKEGGAIAFVCIFLGVAASYLMRRWTKEEKPKLEAQRRLADFEQVLQKITSAAGTLAEVEARVFTSLRDSFDDARKQLDRGNLSAASAALDVMSRKIGKLPQWLTAGRRLTVLEATANVGSIRRDWMKIADAYFRADTAKDEDFATALAAVDKAMADALTDQAIRHVAQFQQRVQVERTTNPNSLARLDREVKPLLDEASAKATAARVDEVNTALARAKGIFAKVLADTIVVTFAGAAPIGFTSKEWTETVATLEPAAQAVKTMVEANDAIAAYERVHRQYLDAIITAAVRQSTKSQIDVQNSTTIPPSDLRTLLEQIGQADAALKLARAHLGNDNYSDANTQYEEAAAKIHAVMQATQRGNAPLSAGAGGGLPATVPSALPPALAATSYEGEVRAPAQHKRKLPGQITDLINRYDLLLNFGVLLIATFLGMKLLWVEDPVWGGWTAYTIAFLWGLGVQQVSGAGFEGLSALTRKLTD